MQPKVDGNLRIVEHISGHYCMMFNNRTGFFLRKEDAGYPEPFWAMDGPELLDVSITNYCEHGCRFCYRQSSRNGKHISLEDMFMIVKQAAEIGVLQIALGGGNPNQHPQFVEILRMIHDAGIVPSYTSNGEGLTHDILLATKENCGAMALSLYPPYYKYPNLVERINKYGIKLNLHVILKSDTVDLLLRWLQDPPQWLENINALIILNYKPVVPGEDLMIRNSDKLATFYSAVSECHAVKIGFDSCCVPGIVTWMSANPILIESCEAARFSAFISEDMKMYPCSFMAMTKDCGDLRKEPMIDIWRDNFFFVNHREKIRENKCVSCRMRSLCNGGCVFIPEINQCRLSSKMDGMRNVIMG